MDTRAKRISGLRGMVCAGALAVATPAALGATVTDIEIVNRSAPDRTQRLVALGTPYQDLEFHTAATVPSAATVDGDTASFTTRMAWVATNHAYAMTPDPLPSNFRNDVAYDLTFTVEDPASSGYLLSFGTLLRGYLTAQWNRTIGANPSLITASGTYMGARLDSGNGPDDIPALDTPFPASAQATDLAPFDNELVSDTGEYLAGAFFGTRTFVLTFAATGALVPNTSASIAIVNQGEAAVRFGLNPTLAGYLQSLTPNPADGEGLDGLGHFVTVNVTDLAATPIPEPGTAALIGAGLLMLGGLARRR